MQEDWTKKILVLCFISLGRDVRIYRKVLFFREYYSIVAAADFLIASMVKLFNLYSAVEKLRNTQKPRKGQ